MDKSKYDIIRLQMERTAEALRRNNFWAECVENREEALEVLEGLLADGMTIAVGGSVTLHEIEAFPLLRSGRYHFLDRYAEGLTREQINEIFTASFSADTYLCSSNAITENGELYNVDGNCNRVAAMLYGPKSVIVVAGYNKIVKNIEEAAERVRKIAAPANAARLNTGNPCTKVGYCVNCSSANRICSACVTLSWQKIPERIKVILVGEELGY